MFGAEVNALLVGRETSNNAPSDTLPLRDQVHLVDWMGVQTGSQLDEGAALSEKGQIDACIVLGGDGVDNEVEFGVFAGHRARVFRDDEEVGALFLRHLLFGSGSRDGDHSVVHGLGNFEPHGTETSNTDDSHALDHIFVCGAPVYQWIVKSDARTENWPRLLKSNGVGNFEDKSLVNDIAAGVSAPGLAVGISRHILSNSAVVVGEMGSVATVLLVVVFASGAV